MGELTYNTNSTIGQLRYAHDVGYGRNIRLSRRSSRVVLGWRLYDTIIWLGRIRQSVPPVTGLILLLHALESRLFIFF